MCSNDSASTRQRSFIERARREQIVQETLDTLAEVGHAQASFARIAARASISPSLISYHFADRAELMRTAALTVLDDLEKALTSASKGADSHPQALAALITGNVHYAADHLNELRALAVLRAAGVAPEQAQEAAALDQIEAFLTDGQAAGQFRRFTPRLMAVTLLAALEKIPAALAHDPSLGPASLAEELVDTFHRATAAD